jgi:sterol desaturase/sphingolipid hydroxylase (fatty acid hydroxylase superfamily)
MGGAGLLYAAVNLLAHANLDLGGGPFAWVFTTPGQHLRHHSLDPDEGRSNYGCAVILWDRLLGTYAGDAAAERATMRLGIGEGRELSLGEQLGLPFWRRL